MKAIMISAIILSCFAISAKAQSVAQKPEDVFKTKSPTGMDSIAWHLPQTPDALKQLLANKFYSKPARLNNGLLTCNNALIVNSTMPVKHLDGNYKTPNLQLISPDSRMNKKVIVTNPQAQPVTP